MHTITLDDGTEIKAELNCNTWESKTKPDDSVFENNTNNVSYTTPGGDIVELGECKYIRGIKSSKGRYLFFLNPLTDEEKNKRNIEKQRADIDYIAIVSDIEL